jgi:hypothetical protein
MLSGPTSSGTLAGREPSQWLAVDPDHSRIGGYPALGREYPTHAQKPNPQHQGKKTNGDAVARGKYVVEGVAMCGQCHTPRESSGNSESSRWLAGAPVPWLPAKPESVWPIKAPGGSAGRHCPPATRT